MHRIDTLVSSQLPLGISLLDLVDRPIMDDHSKTSPYLQDQNQLWMKEKMHVTAETMSP
jgi:hypothetical protein